MATFCAGNTEIICASESMRLVRDAALRVAREHTSVLITGESGVGKNVVARFIHEHSTRAARAFIAVNCAGLSEILLESELFGHSKGSFAGGYRDKVGRLALAHRGSVLLKEIGAIGPRVQERLLTFFDGGEIQPIGHASVSAIADVRIIAATSLDVQDLVANGDLRDDLLHRMNVAHIHVPPLRERRADIRPLIANLISRTGHKVRFSETALRRMEAYDWPGNARELLDLIEHARWSNVDHTVGPEHLTRSLMPEPARRLRNSENNGEVDALYRALMSGDVQFWETVYTRFIDRDLTREDLRELVRCGLTRTQGNYRALLSHFGIPSSDYKRFMNFLTTHDCVIDYRGFRQASRSMRKNVNKDFPVSIKSGSSQTS